MQNKPPIAIMIHDLNPWGGQDRSMLEIAWQLNKEFPLQIHSFSLQGYDNWPDMEPVQYEAAIKKPILLKYLNYQINSWRSLKQKQTRWVQSTGTASLTSDVVQVQFIHHTWQKIAGRMPPDKISSPSPVHQIYHKLLAYYKKELERRIYTADKKYIAISHSIKKELMENFKIPPQNIEIIYHGVDPTYFHPPSVSESAQSKREEVRSQLGIDANDFVLLHVGALNARKGLFQSFRTLGFLKDHGFDNVKLLAVGQGDQKILRRLSKEQNVEDRVILAPHSKDIRNYYWASDCFFFPTYYEPFGLVILEAMACGLPVVASDLAGGSELIEEGVSGFLFDPWSNIQTIGNTLLPLLRDPHLAQQMGQKARAVAETRSWEVVGDEYRQFYKKLGLKS